MPRLPLPPTLTTPRPSRCLAQCICPCRPCSHHHHHHLPQHPRRPPPRLHLHLPSASASFTTTAPPRQLLAADRKPPASWLLTLRQHWLADVFTSQATSSPRHEALSSSSGASSTDKNASTDESKKTQAGTTTQTSTRSGDRSQSPFYFEAGYALFAKRLSRPFPPPFLSQPSGSFSDPLSTHNRSRDRRQEYDGQLIRGVTNGDDAVLVSDNLICANDGVGAWAQKERGHAALWSRLILHFWALEAERDAYGEDNAAADPDPKQYLQRAFERTKEATSSPNELFGTTTASGALLSADRDNPDTPVLYVTQLGDSQILVIRPVPVVAADADAEPAPRDADVDVVAKQFGSVVFKTKEQWHWFDCPRQLGTNSPDTPAADAVLDRVPIQEGDIVLAMSDGVTDNLWEHEVVANVVASFRKCAFNNESNTRNGSNEDDEGTVAAEGGSSGGSGGGDESPYARGMRWVAQELVKAAKVIAQDAYAESPFMERAIDEGLAAEGGKLDDISVVAALCMRRKG